MAAPRFLRSDDRTLFAECGNVFLACSSHQEAPETFALAEGHLHSLVGRYPAGVGFMFLIDHTEGPPPGFLDRVRAILSKVDQQMVGIAIVILTEGFAASIYRSTAAAFITLSGKRSLLHITGQPAEGAAWLGQRLAERPGVPSEADLTAAAEAVLARRPNRAATTA